MSDQFELYLNYLIFSDILFAFGFVFETKYHYHEQTSLFMFQMFHVQLMNTIFHHVNKILLFEIKGVQGP